MAKKKASLAGRAWSLLRLALLWARKGGAFKRGLMLDARLIFKSLRTGGRGAHTDRIHYGEREFSFDETPAFNFKMSRPASMRLPRIPCMGTPSVDFDNDDDWIFFEGERESEFFQSEAEEECFSNGGEVSELEVVVEDEEQGIDSKAEEFIAKFYEQMKLQRQVSLLQYNEMLHRGMS